MVNVSIFSITLKNQKVEAKKLPLEYSEKFIFLVNLNALNAWLEVVSVHPW